MDSSLRLGAQFTVRLVIRAFIFTWTYRLNAVQIYDLFIDA